MKRLILLFIILLYPMLIAKESKLPPIKLKDLNKKKVNLSQFYKEGPILINFWTLACEPCKKEMKHLSILNSKYNKNGFQVVSINMDTPRSLSKVKSFVKSQKFSFEVLSDPKSAIFRKLGGKVMPLVMIADTNGNIVNRHIGYNPGDEKQLEQEIIEILGLITNSNEDLEIPEDVPEEELKEIPSKEEEIKLKTDEK